MLAIKVPLEFGLVQFAFVLLRIWVFWVGVDVVL